MGRARTTVSAVTPFDALWVLTSPEPHPSRATCSIRRADVGFEARVDGLGATLRWRYESREAAVLAAMRLCDQLLRRGWSRCDAAESRDPVRLRES